MITGTAEELHSITSDWVGMRATKLTGGGGRGSRRMGCLRRNSGKIIVSMLADNFK
jgi:hypothetical protein